MSDVKKIKRLFENVTWSYNSIKNSIMLDFDDNQSMSNDLDLPEDLILEEKQKIMLNKLCELKSQLDDLYHAYSSLDEYITSEIDKLED